MSDVSNRALHDALVPLIARAAPGARIVQVRRLGEDSEALESSHKGAGYGAPLAIEIERCGSRERLVLHTATNNQFGHDRRADRAADALLAFDTFGAIPRHVRALEVGAYTRDGGMLSLTDSTEFYVLTTYAHGRPYAHDLRDIVHRASLAPRDRDRVTVLARYLAELHGEAREDAVAWKRATRDLFGSGEGLFGILDSFPDSTPGAPPERLERLERAALAYRARLRARPSRLARIHGDFHPFNIVFSEADELGVLDASRGCLGDPADDVTCLAINFLFFALTAPPPVRAGFGELWQAFFQNYLRLRADDELMAMAPPYFAWRAVVLTNPIWYPDFPAEERDRLLTFVESTLAQGRLAPERAEPLFR